jgi:bifunctional non-homologous end joining protein LigD
MALDEYRQKRNFKASPEPPGDDKLAAKRRTAGSGFFCVQKHLATQLHYDLRLEHDGVLLSWAVPKGPSLNPSDKRLAMKVEDHPIEYGTFEGVIPSGYGAGVVMLWDQGTWTPESSDVDAALAKGDLKIRLDGYKLKGSWVLVRTGGRGGRGQYGGQRSWLLIKHRDEWAGPVDITTFAPRSVKSGGDFPDILEAGIPDVWISHKPGGKETPDADLRRIVEKVLKLKGEQAAPAVPSSTARKSARPGAARKSAATRRRRSS